MFSRKYKPFDHRKFFDRARHIQEKYKNGSIDLATRDTALKMIIATHMLEYMRHSIDNIGKRSRLRLPLRHNKKVL